VIDYSYPPANPADSTAAAKLSRPIRLLSFKLNPDLSVRLFGGSLLVLAR